MATPVREAAFAARTPSVFKAGVLAAVSKELIRESSPRADQAIANILARAVAAFLDGQFLDPAVAASASNPASITNGGPTVTSTGATASAIQTDLVDMTDALQSWGRPTWVMRPQTAAHIASFGDVFPSIRADQADGGFLLGIPVVVSVASPAQIALIDASDIVLADKGETEIDLGDEMALEMNTIPTEGTSPAEAVQLVSFWQRNLVSIRVNRTISWVIGHSTSAVSMAVTY